MESVLFPIEPVEPRMASRFKGVFNVQVFPDGADIRKTVQVE
jgi:hypothetical protein